MMDEARKTLEERYEVLVAATEWHCPIHDDFLSCYQNGCGEYVGEIEADWNLMG